MVGFSLFPTWVLPLVCTINWYKTVEYGLVWFDSSSLFGRRTKLIFVACESNIYHTGIFFPSSTWKETILLYVKAADDVILFWWNMKNTAENDRQLLYPTLYQKEKLIMGLLKFSFFEMYWSFVSINFLLIWSLNAMTICHSIPTCPFVWTWCGWLLASSWV